MTETNDNLHPDVLTARPRRAKLNSWFPIWSRSLILFCICGSLLLWLWGLMPKLQLAFRPQSEWVSVDAKVTDYRRVTGRSPSNHITLDYQFQGKRYVREVDSTPPAKELVNHIIKIRVDPGFPDLPITEDLGQPSPFWDWAFQAFLPGCWLPMAIGSWFIWVREPLRKKALVELGTAVPGRVESLTNNRGVYHVKYSYLLPNRAERVEFNASLDANDYGPLDTGSSVTVLIAPGNETNSTIYPNEWKIQS